MCLAVDYVCIGTVGLPVVPVLRSRDVGSNCSFHFAEFVLCYAVSVQAPASRLLDSLDRWADHVCTYVWYVADPPHAILVIIDTDIPRGRRRLLLPVPRRR